MPKSYTNLIYHLVFSTKDRRPIITPDRQERLYEYLGGIIRGLGGVSLGIMNPPIYVYEPADLGVYSSVAHAELDIEPTDVENGIYLFYDSTGQRLDAHVVKDEKGIERCVIKEISPYECVPNVLRQILIDQLEYFGDIHQKGGKYLRTNLEAMSLQELVAESLVLKIR